jgi:hypothetical protein
MFGEGEWKVKKHGRSKRRMWRKLHLAVDVDTHEIISAEMTLVNVDDCEELPSLLNPLRRWISEVSGDGAYDMKACHKTPKEKKIKPLIPPQNNAGLWETGYPRHEAVIALKAGGLKPVSYTQINNGNFYYIE